MEMSSNCEHAPDVETKAAIAALVSPLWREVIKDSGERPLVTIY
jgi:hypothetical protein